MSDLRDAARQALEALENTGDVWWNSKDEAITALKAALEQPEQEPVADRAAFERHAESLGYSVDKAPTSLADSREGPDYRDIHTHLMWKTWQAALEQDTDCHAQGICQRSGYGIGQPVQEPVDIKPPNPEGATQCIVRWWAETPAGWVGAWDREALDQFTHPPRREWRGLSEEEAAACWSVSTVRTWQAIEAALKEKNHD
jgi:hypothetical protein